MADTTQPTSERQEKVLAFLHDHNIPYTHPEGKTIEEAKKWWRDDGSIHCKNIFMRNHKGNQHYLVCFHCDHDLDIHDLESRLKAALLAQGKNSPGKLSFASPERMMRFLGLEPPRASLPRCRLARRQQLPRPSAQDAVLPPQRLPRHGRHRPPRLRKIPCHRGQHLRVSEALLRPFHQGLFALISLKHQAAPPEIVGRGCFLYQLHGMESWSEVSYFRTFLPPTMLMPRCIFPKRWPAML